MKRPKKQAAELSLKEQRAAHMKSRGFVTVEEASALSLMSRAAIYRWVADGDIGTERAGRSMYVSLADLKAKVPSMGAA